LINDEIIITQYQLMWDSGVSNPANALEANEQISQLIHNRVKKNVIELHLRNQYGMWGRVNYDGAVFMLRTILGEECWL